MNVGHDLPRGLRRSGALAAAALACSGVALASNASPDATYIGRYTTGATETISLEVSANGRRVTAIYVETPIKCGGGCGGIPSAHGGSSAISPSGRFTIRMKLYGPGAASKAEGTETITGIFLKGSRAKGTVTSHFNGGSAGRTLSWTASG